MSPTSDFRGQIIDCLPSLRACARALTRDRERADDLVHDTVVRALAAEDRFQIGTNIKAWLLTILRNKFISDLRRRRLRFHPVDDLADIELAIPAVQIAMVEWQELRRALMRISVRQREVVILVAAMGFSYEHAAEICNCAVGTVKSRLNRARVELRNVFDGTGPTDHSTSPTSATPSMNADNAFVSMINGAPPIR